MFYTKPDRWYRVYLVKRCGECPYVQLEVNLALHRATPICCETKNPICSNSINEDCPFNKTKEEGEKNEEEK